MGVTIKDIAIKLNISKAAVSKALNDKEDISIELKDKVKKTAKEMGYSPNYFAKKLATKKSNTLGVFILGKENLKGEEYYGYKFLDGIIETAVSYAYDILVFSENKNKSYTEIIREKMVEGVIFIGVDSEDKKINSVKDLLLPISIIDFHLKGENISFLSSDSYKGVKSVIDYLTELGHEKIGIIIGGEAEISKRRYFAYKKILESKNLFHKKYVYEGDFTKKSGYEIGKRLFRKKDRPTAIFSVSDLMAIGFIEGVKANGMKIPEDISVVGFDNIGFGYYSNPSLTTVDQNPLEIGQMAVKYIMDVIENKNVNNEILIEPKLIKRKSCKKIK
ncbi:LacI family DNA-binding transcriptional regulator [Haliovirga abyssi]|uniref:LacI family transcriptional regulator n=1 Tax=Haliovirga abyssi TaxID=2996794 RepID=A0AAU9DCM2_9FUSO|nr:LacI family DNA-binding transcriptional regulator [Haliovirga abyssi]BDU51070.1 LacI family transcriptional regulator [Haliovirga abyssi]